MKNWHGYRCSFTCSHFYFREDWSLELNQREFGNCSRREGHGHDYVLEVWTPNDLDLVFVRGAIQKVQSSLDYRNLNALSTFQTKVPTTENLAEWILDQLIQEWGQRPVRLKLYEQPNLWVELAYEGDEFVSKSKSGV